MQIKQDFLTLLSDDEPKFIFRDEFATDFAAGAVNGTTSSDGKATRTVVDTENKISISGGKLVFAGGKDVPASGDPTMWYGGYERVAGKALFTRLTITDATKLILFGFDNNKSAGSSTREIKLANSVIYVNNGNGAIGAFSATTYDLATILTSTGTIHLIKGGLFTSWTFLYRIDNDATATLYPFFQDYDSPNLSVDFLRLAQLPAPFTDDYGIATQQLAGARSNDDTFTHEADCIIEWTQTTLPDAGQYTYFSFRRQDPSNQWYVRIANDGSFILYEIVGGSPTNRGTGAASSIANGQKMVVIAEGTAIKVYANNSLKITYTSATNFATLTAGKLVLGTGGAVSDLVTYPRTLPVHLQSMLNRYVK